MIGTFGCLPSSLDGSERVYSEKHNLSIPLEYSVAKHLGPISNQGPRPICASVSCRDLSQYTALGCGIKNYKLGDQEIYDARPRKNITGMALKEAIQVLHCLKPELKFKEYLVQSIGSAKEAIMANGPLLVALPVKSHDSDLFWVGQKTLGGHAVLFTGWTKDGFELRNSWGTEWANGGYVCFPYSFFPESYELWTLV